MNKIIVFLTIMLIVQSLISSLINILMLIYDLHYISKFKLLAFVQCVAIILQILLVVTMWKYFNGTLTTTSPIKMGLLQIIISIAIYKFGYYNILIHDKYINNKEDVQK